MAMWLWMVHTAGVGQERSPGDCEGSAMEHLGDDRIGRALDQLFDVDLAALLTAVVVAVGQR